MRSLQILLETRISASASRTSWMQKQPWQELGIGLKGNNSPVLPLTSFFCTELHRGDTITTLETFQIGTEFSMHVNLGQGFPPVGATALLFILYHTMRVWY